MARAALIGMALFLAACKSEPTELRLEGETMGTTYHIVALDADDRLDDAGVKAAVETALTRVNAQMSNWDPNSEVSKFDARQDTDPVAISPELAKVMAAAAEVNRLSEGQFDVTLGPLIELWGFGARTPETPHPSDAAITAALGHWIDTGVLLAAVLINAIVGFIQEGRAESALSAPTNVMPSVLADITSLPRPFDKLLIRSSRFN